MTQIPVEAETPSARTEPRIVTAVAESPVSWHPDRGWMCEAHQIQPCSHTADLVPAKHPEWNQ